MRIGETFELEGKTYVAAAEPLAGPSFCGGCAFFADVDLCGSGDRPRCDGVIFVEVPAAPDYSPILAGILAGKVIQLEGSPGVWAAEPVDNVYRGMSNGIDPAVLRVKPDTVKVNGVTLPTPATQRDGTYPGATDWVRVLWSNGPRAEYEASLYLCATEADAKALYDAITSTLPKAPTP